MEPKKKKRHMLYQLTGDEEAGSVFLGENAEILHNTNWQDVEKNH